ncbi:YIP1 family protein [Ktedonobacteria bacterium brp13]|nr:YIP1 family protein [Ktedonobacteria bacterium brp13]
MSYDPNNQENPPEDPSTPPNSDDHPAGDSGNPGNPDYPPFGGPGYPPPGNPGYPPFGGPGYPPPGNPGYPPFGGPGYPPPGNPGYPPFGGPGYPPPGNPGYPPFGGPGYPPPGNPGYPPPYPGYNPPPQFTPRPLGETLQQLPRQYWRVLSHPGAATFAEEQAYASWGAIWVQLIGYTLISAIFTFVFEAFVLPTTFSAFFNAFNVPDQNNSLQQMTSFYQSMAVGNVFTTLISNVVGSFIVVGIYWLIAKAFRGQGPFLQYMYCYLLIFTPLGIISSLLAFIPIVGFILSFALGIYGIVLFIMMTMGVHRMSGGKATLAVLILPIALAILSCIAFVGLFAIILSAAHNMQYMPTPQYTPTY